ncbi:hypothetical protein U9M48_009543 [Paspalum notatum var. saurae]|uniref:Vps52 coiled-coil domain-containing protein n=1 Tax=Paspalum notatum var. saurae TaxID=547442 RepID=A0AAQ3WF68_PASNO
MAGGVHEQRIEQQFRGFFSFDEDSESEDISLDELEEELEEHKDYDVLITILTNGEKQRGMATLVEGNLGHIEESLIEDYIEDNDSLVLLHDQIHDCDIILSQIESFLSGFQVHIGSISSEIRSLQEKSLDISVKLKNRKVNDGYARSLEILSKKLRFVQVNPLINASKALKDIKQELERLRQKAVSKRSLEKSHCFIKFSKLVMSNRRLLCLENYFDKCDEKTLWIDGTRPHHIARCYVEFTASLVELSAECGDGQEAGDEAKKLQTYFEEKLETEDLIFCTERTNIADVEPLVKNFAVKWRSALELLHNEVKGYIQLRHTNPVS